MWLLILSLYFMQQDTGSKVEVQHLLIDKIPSEQLCRQGGEAWKTTHKGVATEPHLDDDGKKRADDWDLTIPVFTCIPTGIDSVGEVKP